MRFAQSVLVLICVVIMTGCGSGGLLNLSPAASGNIVITNTANGAALQTTLAAPFSVTGGAFSIGITEDHFSGPYTVSITTWTAPFNLSCFLSHYVNQTDKTNVVKFSADNAAPVTAPTQPSPCNPFTAANGVTQTDEETAQITDGKGHTVSFYYKIAGATPGGSTGSPTAVKLAVSWSGPSPTTSACGAYVLNVGAVSANGTAVSTSAANPITLSTTGGGYMGFSVATSGAASFTCPLTTGSGSPGGTPTLQLTTSPTQVLVYFNGPGAATSTTITANSVGLPPTTLAITNSAPTPASALALSWSGPSPSGSACGAYVLNVGAVNANGSPIPTTSGNPITLSTTGGGYMGFAAVTAASAGFTCPLNGLTLPGGTSTLQVTTSPTQVLVYFNGFAAPGNTTITASSVGSTPATDTISVYSSTVVDKIVLAFLPDIIPTALNCGAFNLSVTAYSSGVQIVSSSYSNPITLSTNSATWSGFSTVTAGILPAPPPAALVCSPPNALPAVGTPTLTVPNTATPTALYYDGPFDTASNNGTNVRTTITATAPGPSGTVYSNQLTFP